jgi:hypothetical protein
LRPLVGRVLGNSICHRLVCDHHAYINLRPHCHMTKFISLV